MPVRKRVSARGYAAAVASVAVGYLLQSLFAPSFEGRLPFFWYYPGVMFTAWYGGTGPGLLASVLSLLASTVFAPPSYALSFSNVSDLPALILFAFVAGAISRFIGQLKTVQLQAGQLARIVETSDDAIISKSLEGIIQSWNFGAEKIYGYTAEEAVGQSVALLLPPGQADEVPHLLAQMQQGERVGTYETRRRRKDGTILTVALTASPLWDERGRMIGASSITRDITERKVLEQALQQKIEEMEELNRRKDHFLAMLGHELRNPLGAMKNSLYLLKRGDVASPTFERLHAVLDRQVRTMTFLVDDLLDISRITRGTVVLRRERVDLTQIIQDSLEDWRGNYQEADITLTSTVPDAPIMVQADAERLSQIMINLLSNALKFTKAGGCVEVAVKAMEDTGEASVTVRDTGIGIAPEALSSIFETFVQVEETSRRSQGGLGLGLALVKGLAELHGGRIVAQSDGPGRGAEFTFFLPLERKGA